MYGVVKRIRLYGIDAPETRTRDLEEKKKGIETKERLQALLEANKNIFVVRSHGVEKYGRCLGTLLVNGSNLNEVLLNEGYVKEYK